MARFHEVVPITFGRIGLTLVVEPSDAVRQETR